MRPPNERIASRPFFTAKIRRWRIAAAALTVCATAFTISACTPAEPDDSAGSGQVTSSPGSDQVTSSAVGVPLPETPAGTTSQWIVDLLNSGQNTVPADWEGRLDPGFTAEVSIDELVELVNRQLRPARPFTVTGYEGDANQAVTTLTSPSSPALDMTVTMGPDGQIVGLFFGPSTAQDPREQPTSFEELEEQLEQFPATVHALIISADDLRGDGEALLDLAGSEPAPLASIFKIYVLLAVSDAVAAGELSWDDELTVNDEVRSLPSGELQDEPSGTVVTVREAATKMIEISDNTATDMLIQRLGRDSVESAVEDAGHHDPRLLEPFPSTREMFQIEWGNPVYLERWTTGSSDERRALLDEISRLPFSLEDIELSNDPLWHEGVEWFASPRDIAAAHLALQDSGDPMVREIMARNPGVSGESWDYVAFKGGSSVGVLTGSWLVEDSEGNQYVIVIQAASEDAAALAAEQSEFFLLAESALTLAHP